MPTTQKFSQKQTLRYSKKQDKELKENHSEMLGKGENNKTKPQQCWTDWGIKVIIKNYEQ